MKSLLPRLLREKSGVTAVEYALIAALIAVAIIASTKAMGTRTSGTFSNITVKMK